MLDNDHSDRLVRQALRRLSEKWTPSVIRALAEGPRRYSDLQRTLGVAPKVLTDRLKALGGDGFVTRLESPGVQMQVSYGLTPLGLSLAALLTDVESWGGRQTGTRPSSAPCGGWPVTTGSDGADGIDDPPGAAPLDAMATHLCVAVRDIERSAKAYAEVFGAIGAMASGPVYGPEDRRGWVRKSAFRLSNFSIELMQPAGGWSPFTDVVDRHGEGVHHLGLRVRRGFDQQLDLLQRAGGRPTAGGRENGYALFDLEEPLGATLEIVRPEIDGASTVAPHFHSLRALANSPLSHIGIMVRDVAAAAKEYARILGVGSSPIRTVTPIFSPGVKAARGAGARIARLRHRGIALLLIEPNGGSPWRDFLDERGNAIHHLAFNVQERGDEIARNLERHGGRWVVGRPGQGFAQFDFTEPLGLAIGVTSTRRRAARPG